MEKICIFFITMSSIVVFAMPSFSERDLDAVTDTFTEPLERLIVELDDKIDFLRSGNDVDSLNTFKTFQDLRFEMKQIYRDQSRLSTHMAAYKRDVSIVYCFIGFCVFLVCLFNDALYRLFREDNRTTTMKIACVVLPVLPIILLYWSVMQFHRIHFSDFY